MIAKLTIGLENSEKLVDIKSSSLFHGFLMEQLEYEYAEILHQNGWKPYTTSIRQKEDILLWEITTLNLEAKEKVIDHLLKKELRHIYLSYKKLKLEIVSMEKTEVSYDDLLEENYFKDGSRYLTIFFNTPTSFKSQGQYVFFPDMHLIYQSIMNKYDTVSKDNTIFHEEVLEQILTNTQVINYHLKSCRFYLEGVKIPSFTGQIKIKIHGPQMLVNLVHYILQFATYSGVGIKTSIGMGKISLEKGGTYINGTK